MDFQPWPKTPRLFRDIVVTEKIDGANAAVRFLPEPTGVPTDPDAICWVTSDATGPYAVYAQSRNRLLSLSDDNQGFAAWVVANSVSLFEDLGEGIRFGEFWGQGIGRKYGQNHKRFSLFNTAKWDSLQEDFETPALDVVPVLYQGPFDELAITHAAKVLADEGSVAAPGFMRPEGICVYHTGSRSVFKYTLDGDAAKG